MKTKIHWLCRAKGSSFFVSVIFFTFHFSLFTFLFSCSKELDVDYQDVEPQYVVEGTINEDSCLVILSQTSNLSGSTAQLPMDDAVVTVTLPDGSTQQLRRLSENRFSAPIHAEAGKTYGLKVEVAGKTFTSQSTMQKPPYLYRCYVNWQNVATVKMLVSRFVVRDDSTMENFYYCHIYRANKSYAWDVANDRWASATHAINYPVAFVSEDVINDDKPEDADKVLHVGDTLHFHVRSIDKAAFDYFYALHQNGSKAINPKSNIQGGCYGYFSAYSERRMAVVIPQELMDDKEFKANNL